MVPANGGGCGPKRLGVARKIRGVDGKGGVAQGWSEEAERGVSEGPGLTPPSPAGRLHQVTLT